MKIILTNPKGTTKYFVSDSFLFRHYEDLVRSSAESRRGKGEARAAARGRARGATEGEARAKGRARVATKGEARGATEAEARGPL